RIAVTGATGFLGRYIVRLLAGTGHRLRCWYRPASDRSGLEDVAAAVEWLPGELGDATAPRRMVAGVVGVIYTGMGWPRGGSISSAGRDDLAAFLQTNLMGSLQLFEAAHAAGVPRFVFISTCAVHEVILEDRPLDEAHPLWPTSPYGAHKAALEKFVHSYGLG